MTNHVLIFGRAILLGVLTGLVIVGFNIASFAVWSRISSASDQKTKQALLVLVWLVLLALVCGLLAILMLGFWYDPAMSTEETLLTPIAAAAVLFISWRSGLLKSFRHIKSP